MLLNVARGVGASGRQDGVVHEECDDDLSSAGSVSPVESERGEDDGFHWGLRGDARGRESCPRMGIESEARMGIQSYPRMGIESERRMGVRCLKFIPERAFLQPLAVFSTHFHWDQRNERAKATRKTPMRILGVLCSFPRGWRINWDRRSFDSRSKGREEEEASCGREKAGQLANPRWTSQLSYVGLHSQIERDRPGIDSNQYFR